MTENPEYSATDPAPDPATDPDLAAARAAVPDDPGDAEGAEMTDELLPEERLTEFEPPDRPSPALADPPTGEDEAAGENIEDRLRQEQRDV